MQLSFGNFSFFSSAQSLCTLGLRDDVPDSQYRTNEKLKNSPKMLKNAKCKNLKKSYLLQYPRYLYDRGGFGGWKHILWACFQPHMTDLDPKLKKHPGQLDPS